MKFSFVFDHPTAPTTFSLTKIRRPNDRKFAQLRPFLYKNFAILRCVEEKKQKYNELCT